MNGKKFIVNLYGGPGTGKSTTAAGLFNLLKINNHNTELVREYIKDWVWEGREIKKGDNTYIAAKQARKESVLFKDVDVIITDSPMWLTHFYENLSKLSYPTCENICKNHQELARSEGFEYLHVFLNRKKKYHTLGRLQNEEEAANMDKEMKNLLKDHVEFTHVDADSKAPEIIYRMIVGKL